MPAALCSACDIVAQVGITGVASVLLIMPVAAMVPVLLAGVYHTGTIEGPSLLYVGFGSIVGSNYYQVCPSGPQSRFGARTT